MSPKLSIRAAVFAALLTVRLFSFDGDAKSALSEARTELFAARYEHAVSLYKALLATNSSEADIWKGDAWYGLVRAELSLRHSRDAYASADDALRAAPQSAGAQTAAGLAAYRRGDLSKAEANFRAALKISPNYPGALTGMAAIYSSLSMFKTARDLRLRAYACRRTIPS